MADFKRKDVKRHALELVDMTNLQWFVAGWLCAVHGWLGVAIAAALTIPFRLVRRVVAYVEEAGRG